MGSFVKLSLLFLVRRVIKLKSQKTMRCVDAGSEQCLLILFLRATFDDSIPQSEVVKKLDCDD